MRQNQRTHGKSEEYARKRDVVENPSPNVRPEGAQEEDHEPGRCRRSDHGNAEEAEQQP